MRNTISSKICGWLAAAGVLLTASCAQDETVDPYASGETVTVSFTLAPEGMTGTRSHQNGNVTYPDANEFSHISDGSQTDLLIYAVYDESGERLLEQYGRGLVDPSGALAAAGIEAGIGQTVMLIDEFPVSIEFRLVRNQKYTIAFWAQNSACKAYNTENLKKVEVIYSILNDNSATPSTPNNDETRDAFCKNAKVEGKEQTSAQTIYLYRPLAQINVGTAGYDYEIITRGENSKKFTASRIQLGNVARYLDVAKNEVKKSTTVEVPDGNPSRPEALAMVDFSWNKIPAYVNIDVPADPSYELAQSGEEFLVVDLDGDGEVAGYIGLDGYTKEGAAKQAGDANYTETFKYLSMCYVLVPDALTQEGDEATDLPGGQHTTTTLDNVTVWLTTQDASGNAEDENEVQIVQLSNVPVHRNWRTNIIGQNLLTAEASLSVNISPFYNGDYNTEDGGETWSGALYDGVSYNAEDDEILISNANGMMWLAKMVNGKYSCPVLTTSGATEYFSDNGIEDPTTSDAEAYKNMSAEQKRILKQRILTATHQENGWPKNNNFHFMGTKKGPANVRLGRDINMSGIEWIPIGYRSLIGDTYEYFTHENADHVGFCGKFDGGDHTISNMKNKRFSASVHPNAFQDTNYAPPGQSIKSAGYGPYDKAVQWFPTGLFGEIAEDAVVRNVRLRDIDLYGYHCAGAIAGIATGKNIYIENCYIDGGTITLSPMYRGDAYHTYGRTFARGIYLGGIVGQFNVGTKDGYKYENSASILNCDIRNLTLHGYRNVGGLVGTVKKSSKLVVSGYSLKEDSEEIRTPRKIAGNTLSNVTILGDKFQVYDVFWNKYGKQDTGSVYMNGFGWIDQPVLSNKFVGGTDTEEYPDNIENNVLFVEFGTGGDGMTSQERVTTINDNIPLSLLPLMSSWFTDKITLGTNFNGTHSAYRKTNMYEFDVNCNNKSAGTYSFPFNLPYDLSVSFQQNSGKVGMYVETVDIKGMSSSKRSVITVTDAKEEKDCVMFITSRDRQSYKKTTGWESNPQRNLPSSWNPAQPTTVTYMVLRGDPYAYTGICLSPNASTSSITLDHVAVYDVYQTLALDNSSDVDASNAELKVTGSNLRGYTNYGSGWKSVTFTDTVFERGADTNKQADDDEINTCAATANTTFEKCWFKAPYVIKISGDVTFSECKATAASDVNITLAPPAGCTEIRIDADKQGNATVKYLPEA